MHPGPWRSSKCPRWPALPQPLPRGGPRSDRGEISDPPGERSGATASLGQRDHGPREGSWRRAAASAVRGAPSRPSANACQAAASPWVNVNAAQTARRDARPVTAVLDHIEREHRGWDRQDVLEHACPGRRRLWIERRITGHRTGRLEPADRPAWRAAQQGQRHLRGCRQLRCSRGYWPCRGGGSERRWQARPHHRGQVQQHRECAPHHLHPVVPAAPHPSAMIRRSPTSFRR